MLLMRRGARRMMSSSPAWAVGGIVEVVWVWSIRGRVWKGPWIIHHGHIYPCLCHKGISVWPIVQPLLQLQFSKERLHLPPKLCFPSFPWGSKRRSLAACLGGATQSPTLYTPHSLVHESHILWQSDGAFRSCFHPSEARDIRPGLTLARSTLAECN